MVSERKVPPSDGTPSGLDAGSRTVADDETVSEAFSDAGRYLNDAIKHFRAYLTAQADRVRVVIRNTILMAILALGAGIVALTVIISATVLLCVGIAEGLGTLLGGRLWAGDLIVGVVVLGSIAVGTRIVVRRIVQASRIKTQMQYERRTHS